MSLRHSYGNRVFVAMFSSIVVYHRPNFFQAFSLFHENTSLVSGECRAAFARWCREFGLDVHLLHTVCLRLKLVVDLVELVDRDTVGDHLEGVDLALLNHHQQLLPVEVYGRLAVSDEANTALHKGADVEVIGL